MKQQNGGELRCNRIPGNDKCISVSCVDYEKGIFNSNVKTKCSNEKNNKKWIKYYDDQANANYWFNNETGEATWIPQENEGGKSKKRQKKRKTNRKRKTKRNKKI
jgi:hypothetical protein